MSTMWPILGMHFNICHVTYAMGLCYVRRVTYAVGMWYIPCVFYAVGIHVRHVTYAGGIYYVCLVTYALGMMSPVWPMLWVCDMSPVWYHVPHVTYGVGIWYVHSVSYVVDIWYMFAMWPMLGYILMAQCKPSVTPSLAHWIYCSLAMWLMLRVYIMSWYICNSTNVKLCYMQIVSWNIFGVFIRTDMHSFFRLIGIYFIVTCIFMCYPTCTN